MILSKLQVRKPERKLKFLYIGYVKAVLKKYNGKMPKQLNNDKTNYLIKIICQSAFIRRMTAIPHTKGGVKLNPEPVEKWNLCHSHTARRSLCTEPH